MNSRGARAARRAPPTARKHAPRRAGDRCRAATRRDRTRSSASRQPCATGSPAATQRARSSRLLTLPVGNNGSASTNSIDFGHLYDAISARSVIDDLLPIDARTRPQHHHGPHRLAPVRIGHADHRDFAHRRVLRHRLLDFAAVDVLAARDDHVLLAVDEVQVALVVDVADVAGVHPAVAQRLRGRIRVVPVAEHRGVGLCEHLARHAAARNRCRRRRRCGSRTAGEAARPTRAASAARGVPSSTC